MMLATPVRSSEWSSTTSTRERLTTADEAACGSAVAIVRPWNRERGRLPGEDDFHTRPRRSHERQRGADPLRALAHDGHSEPRCAAIARDPDAIVRHRQAEADAADGARVHDDAAGAAVADGVGERLLGDADDFGLDAGG